MYADDIQLCLSFMPLSTSRRHGALRTIQALVSDKNSWDPSTQHCFYFWPVSWSSQCWLSQSTHQILHTNIGRERRQQSARTILTETVVSQTFKLGMVTNGLKINDKKMEFLFVGSRQQLSKVQLESVTVQDSEISVRNLGACLMGIHVSKVCSKDLRDLYSIRPIRKYLSEDATKVLVHAFVTSRLDYCNYLLFGFQNTNVIRCRGFLAAAAARIVCLVPKFSHHTPAFIIYIGYQCPSASSATRPPSSRWCWPCLPKEVSKIQGKWSLQFKI